MKVSQKYLKRLIEMAVRQDILDTAKGSGKRTMLMKTALDFTNWPENLGLSQPSFGNAIKPTGLWYGYGTQWIDFIRNPNNKGLIEKYTEPEYFYEIDVHITDIDNPDEHKVLYLKDSQDLAKLKNNYRVVRAGGMFLVDWLKISFDFGGLEVSDDLDMYFGWDIPSGCVWNKNAFKDIKILQDPSITQNIPKGAAALGKVINFNPNAKKFSDIKNKKILNYIDEYESDYYYSNMVIAEENDYEGDTIWEKIEEMFNFDEEDWFKIASGTYKLYTDNISGILSAGIWLINNYNQRTGEIGGGFNFVYRLRYEGTDFNDVLSNLNNYLNQVSDILDLGIKVDLNHDNSWSYAVSSVDLANSDY